SSIHSVAPIQSTKEPEHSLSIGYEHPSITPKTESDEVTESNAENLLPILSKCEVNSLISNQKFQNPTLILKKKFILLRICFMIIHRPPEELNAEIVDTIIESIPLPIPVQDGDVHFLKELIIDDSILSDESSDSNFEDNPSISRPRTEQPDDNFDLVPEVISAEMEDIDEPDEHFNQGGEIFVSTNNKDVDYFPFMFVIQIFLPYLILPEISPLFLSTESEDTIFDP
nr:hypothetical protein [Tanacetum cinerariifolium]